MKKGFTLIEMLTVVAIIAILCAVIYPILAGVSRRHQHNSVLPTYAR